MSAVLIPALTGKRLSPVGRSSRTSRQPRVPASSILTSPPSTTGRTGPGCRGAYHFALPNVAGGAAQASYFVANGGGWSADGRTLPGALDIEYNPYGAECYGLSHSAMVSWITSFVDAYQALTTRWPIIYTTGAWWTTCTGGYGGFAGQDPLWIAGSTSPGALPGGWGFYTFWQYASDGTFPGDQDTFNGATAQLLRIATGR